MQIFRSKVNLLVILLTSLVLSAALHASETITLTASDGVKVYGDFYPATGKSAPYILLFHQAGSNRAEYAPIAPRLVKLGFNCLAIDQRSGGNMWGQTNETVEHIGHNSDYLDALKDMEAALAWVKAKDHDAKVLVWGSSYSASLVFVLAEKHPDEIAGVWAFSPGEYFADYGKGKHFVRDAASHVSVPVFVTSAKDKEEIEEAKAILEASPSKQKTQFVPKTAGIHGSSTLRADRDKAGEAENWAAVEAFLANFH